MSMEISMPEFVDDLPQILWWELDEFAGGIGLFGVGLMMHHMMWGLIAAFFVLPFIKKMKGDGLNGAAMQVICATGIMQFNKEFPDLLEKDLFL